MSGERGGRVRRAAQSVWGLRWAAVAAALSGVAVFLSFPEWDLWPLAFVALTPALWAVEQGSAKRAFVLGLIMGTVTNAGGFYWVTGMLQDYGYLPFSVSAALTGALAVQQGVTWAVAFAVGRRLASRGAPVWLAYGTALGCAETVLPLIFPWYFGNSQYLNTSFAQVAEIGGVVLVSVALVAVNGALYRVAADLRGRRRPAVHALVVLGLTLVAHAWGASRASTVREAAAASDTLSVGIVQANIGIYDKGSPALAGAQLVAHQRLSAELEANGAELIVWPETAFDPETYVFADRPRPAPCRALDPADCDPAPEAFVAPRLDRYATQLPPSPAPLPPSDARDPASLRERSAPQRGFRTPLLTGTLMWSRRTPEEAANMPPRGGRPWHWNIHNSAILLDSDGWVLGAYDKTLRMLFSEHVPGGAWVWRATGFNLYDVIPAAGQFYGGQPTDGFVLPTAAHGDVRLGVMICYEDIMQSFGRAIHSGRPHMLVNVTNDAWFGDTAEPRLHLALATFRSIEQRTMMVRATNTGISAFISATGEIVAETPTFEAATLQWDVPIMEATTTPFMRFGNWSPWVGLLACVAAAFARARRRRAS